MAEEVEVFVSPGVSSKDVVCPPPSIKSAATRRWNMLRNTSHAASALRRSLTTQEKDFLDSIEAGSNEKDVKVGSAPESAARRALWKSIRSCVALKMLGETEVKFLETIAASDKVSDEHVRASVNALACDRVLKSLTCRDDELREQPEAKKRCTLQQDASFRKELWTNYISKSSNTVTQKRREPKISDEETSQDLNTTPPAGVFESFERFFGFGVSPQPKEKEKQEEAQDDKEDVVVFTILGTSVEDTECLPHVLSPPIMDALRPYLPFSVRADNFWLKYAMKRDGSSMLSLVQRVRNSSRTLIAIETFDGTVCGAFVSSPWIPCGSKYFGNGEAFLFRMKKSRFTRCSTVNDQIELEKDVEVFPWSGENQCVQLLERPTSQLVIGGGLSENSNPSECDEQGDRYGFGLQIDPCLSNGYSSPCITFKSPSLPPSGEDAFEIANIEVWTLSPVDDVRQAENLELGRRFIFDHSAFAEE